MSYNEVTYIIIYSEQDALTAFHPVRYFYHNDLNLGNDREFIKQRLENSVLLSPTYWFQL